MVSGWLMPFFSIVTGVAQRLARRVGSGGYFPLRSFSGGVIL